MKIFVDFDNTIFDARHEFLENFYDVFYQYGVSRDVFDETAKEFSKTPDKSGKCLSPINYIEKIIKHTGKNINKTSFINEINQFLENLETYVYEDLYEFARAFDKKDLIILSYGDNKYQKQKIDGSGIEQFFGNVIITQGSKSIEIDNYMKKYPDELAVLIDDKAEYFKSVKKLSINTKTIHILRNDKKCGNNEFCDIDEKTLSKIKTHIIDLLS